jgi:cyclase
MFRPRVIPILLLKEDGLVKSVRFKDYRYIGDPMNAVKIFNDKKADELIFLDINATNENRTISLDLVREIGEECNMPFSVGGGIKTIDQIRDILKAGAEKVCINTAAVKSPEFIKEAADYFGSSTITVSIDVKKKLFGKYEVVTENGRKSTKNSPMEFAQKMEKMGAGELLLMSVDNDGLMQGYDIELIKNVSDSVSIPVIACGGAANLNDFRRANEVGHASAVAAGSMFVYHGPRKAVLISFPTKDDLIQTFSSVQ